MSNTFMTDCPVCHLHFCGFHKYDTNIMINGKTYRIICHRCAAERTKANERQ